MRIPSLLLFLCLGLVSCTQDKVLPREKCTDQVTYDDLQFLLQRKCTTSGCHDGSSGYGDYRSYNGLLTDIRNGSVEAEVIQKGSMPQNDTLSDAEFHMIQCWIDNGYLAE